MEYLTDQDYEIAEQNGISKSAAYQRFYNYEWSKERAITEKINAKESSLYSQYKEKCRQNNVSGDLFRKRLKKGMSPEEAASKPPEFHRPWGRYGDMSENYKIAEKNGINPRTVRTRIYTMKWSVEKAITVLVRNRS